jgi:hypothetical protein
MDSDWLTPDGNFHPTLILCKLGLKLEQTSCQKVVDMGREMN